MNINRGHILTYGIVAGATLIGFAGGYHTARKRVSKEFNDIFDAEVENLKDHYARKHKDGAYSTPESAAAVLIAPEDGTIMTEELQYDIPDEIPEELHHLAKRAIDLGEEPVAFVTRAMLGITDQTVQYADQVQRYTDAPVDDSARTAMVQRATRDETKPHVITIEEFHANEDDLEQLELTWWLGDRQLADERDQPIVDVNGTVGLRNLDLFGQNSSDPNTLYIRNNKLHTLFEVNLDPRKYGVIVAGEEALDALPQPTRGPRRGRDD